MKLHQFVANLSSKLDKRKIIEDVEFTIQELTEYTLPSYQNSISANLFTQSSGFKSAWFEKRNHDFLQYSKTGLKGSVVEQTHFLLSKCADRLNWMRDTLEKEADITKDGLSYSKAALLQVFEATRFYVQYSRKFLLLGYSYEAKALGVDSTDSHPYTKAEILEIEQQFSDYMRVSQVFAKNGNNIRKVIEQIPDITVDVSGQRGVTGMVPETKLDPLRFNFGAHAWNPIWWTVSAIAESQHRRYVAAKTERQALEIRLLQMKMGQKDATTEKALSYHEQRLKDLNFKIDKWEKAHA